jgi:hypothetical protein
MPVGGLYPWSNLPRLPMLPSSSRLQPHGWETAADASIAHYLAASEGMRVMMDVCWKICAALLSWSQLREQSKCCPWRSCCSSVPKTT